jgi:hypothetical protein
MQKLRHPSEVDALFGGQWRRRSLLSVGDLGTCRALAGLRGGRHLREIVVRRAGPRAGSPKDGNGADLRLLTGTLVVEARFGSNESKQPVPETPLPELANGRSRRKPALKLPSAHAVSMQGAGWLRH